MSPNEQQVPYIDIYQEKMEVDKNKKRKFFANFSCEDTEKFLNLNVDR